jgi:hypothetical protein
MKEIKVRAHTANGLAVLTSNRTKKPLAFALRGEERGQQKRLWG